MSDDRRCVLLKVWSGSLGRPVAHIGDKSSGSAVCVAFHPSGQQVLAGFHSGHLRLYDIATGMNVLCVLTCVSDNLRHFFCLWILFASLWMC